MRQLWTAVMATVALLGAMGAARAAAITAEADNTVTVQSAAPTSPKAAPDSLALMSEVAAVLNHAPVISGHFEQRKTLAGFKNPLVSSGTFAAARDHGIVWHTQAPFESVLSVTQARIAAQQDGGKRQTLIGAGDEPVLRMVNEVLYAIMTADLQILAQQFEISGRRLSGQDWELDLQPRDAVLRQWINRVQLWGDAYVRKVVLHEAQEDQSVIVLSDHQAGSKVPDALLGE